MTKPVSRLPRTCEEIHHSPAQERRSPRPAHSSHPTALENARRGPGVLGEKPLSRRTPPRPSGGAPNAAAALGCLGRPFAVRQAHGDPELRRKGRGHPLARRPASSGEISSKAKRGLQGFLCGLCELCGSRSVALFIMLAAAAPAVAQAERPGVGPERPFQLAPRVERTLANGLRVIVTRQMVVPKVTMMLTVLSGYASD